MQCDDNAFKDEKAAVNVISVGRILILPAVVLFWIIAMGKQWRSPSRRSFAFYFSDEQNVIAADHGTAAAELL